MTYSPCFYPASAEGPQTFIGPVSVPIRVVIQNNESENGGGTLVTPQQRRRRPVQHPHHRRNRKFSAPPELQAHLGNQKSLHTINFPFIIPKGGSPNLDARENSIPPEVIINFNNSNKLGIAEGGLNSGSDSGVPSEYSSWAAPVARTLNSSPYEDYPRSISASLDDIPNSGNLRPEYNTDTDDEDMSSPQPSQRSEGITNTGFVNTENQQSQPINMPRSCGPSPHPPHPHSLNRANTDTNLLTGLTTPRARTNSMVFQLNLSNGLPAVSNPLSHARSVSMISLNTAGNSGSNIPITYPNLSGMNHDTQSMYSDAGGTHNFTPGFLGLGNNTGSQGSLSGVGYGPPGSLNPPHNHDEDHDEPQSTDPVIKERWFIDTLCANLSTMYAILLFMIGCVLYFLDKFNTKSNSAIGEAFNVYLIIVQLIWLGYIHMDVRRYVNTISNALKEAKEKDVKGEPVQLETTPDGHYQLRINLPEPRKTYLQHYGFTSGRHGGSLYLKIGAAVFCLGYLIHSGLNLGQKIHYLFKEDPAFEACTCIQDVLMSVLQPIYAFYQLFFIFKYSNLIINRRKRLSKLALMHCISSSLLFWVYTIIQETVQAISSKKAKSEGYGSEYNFTTTPSYKPSLASVIGDENDSEEGMDDNDEEGSPFSYRKEGFKLNLGCGLTTPLTKMINDTTPYLYPFSIEYNILIVGIWILLWENIGRMDRHTHLPSISLTDERDNTNGIASNLIIYVDCHSSNRGLFAGLLMTVATVISIILFFIFTADEKTKYHGLQVNGYSELIVHVIMIIVAILSYLAIRNLDIVKHKISKVDDILLYICLPCIFLYAVFIMVPAFTHGSYLFVAVSIVQVIQAVIQTALICDGLRRCSNSSHLNTKKPGREMITFMIVANVALWLLETFEIKSEDGNFVKYEYYGKVAWTLLSHMTLPLALFYRFHSSVCLVDIWKGGYEVESEH